MSSQFAASRGWMLRRTPCRLANDFNIEIPALVELCEVRLEEEEVVVAAVGVAAVVWEQ